jgi:hypothetical protein
MISSSSRSLPSACSLHLDAPAQRIHKIGDFRRFALARRLDLLAGLLLLQQIPESIFVLILKLFQIEMTMCMARSSMSFETEPMSRSSSASNVRTSS